MIDRVGSGICSLTLLVSVLQQKQALNQLQTHDRGSWWQQHLLVVLQTVGLITDEQVTGSIAPESVCMCSESLVRHYEYLQGEYTAVSQCTK